MAKTKSAKSQNGRISSEQITSAAMESNSTLKLKPIMRKKVSLRIVGRSPLIQHQWSEKALKMMRDKHAGKKTKTRDVRDPHAEGMAAMYTTDKGKPGVPAMAIKSALLTAAHKDIGIAREIVKKAIFIDCSDSKLVIEMDCDEPVIKEDPVRVGNGAADLRYRPYFHRWAVNVTWEIDTSWLQVEDLINLVNRAGFGVGICEWRPENGGEYGRFEVDATHPVGVVDL